MQHSDQSEVLQELLFLYELSLTIGQSLNLEENAEKFLRALINNESADMAVLWLAESVKAFHDPLPDDLWFAFKALPQPIFNRNAGDMGEFLKKKLGGRRNYSFELDRDHFHDGHILPKGHYALFALGDIGALMLYKTRVSGPKEMASKIWQLENITQKFLVSLEGCLAYRKNTNEMSIRKEAEERLKEKQIQLNRAMERFNLAINGSSGGIWDRNLKSDRVIFSEQWLTLLGYDQTPLPYRWESFQNLIHKADIKAIHATVDSALKGERDSFEFECRLKHEKGYYIWARNKGVIVPDDRGEPDRMVAIMWDITREKKDQAKLIESHRLAEEALQVKSQFLSIMSHEIRTPMNAVINLTNLICEDNPPEHQQENLNALQYSAEYLMNILNDILDYNKIEAGQLTLENKSFDLHRMLNHVINLMKNQIGEKNLKLKLTIEDEVPIKVVGDEARLAQVLNNLINNAIKFTPEGSVELRVKQTGQLGDSILLYFEVVDTGIGVAADKLEAIFDRFTQANTSISREFGGTGLGLAICRRLLEMQNSQICIRSEEGVGTTFFFELAFSLSDQQRDRIPAKEVGFEDLNGASILLVEDNTVNIVVAKKFLKKWNLNITVARNGIESLDKISTAHFDLILMDLNMPKMDGLTASRKIRKIDSEHYSQIPIIALSANILNEVEQKIDRAGIDDFVSKPFHPRELHDKIKFYLNNGRGKKYTAS